jgi:hypothetical protein
LNALLPDSHIFGQGPPKMPIAAKILTTLANSGRTEAGNFLQLFTEAKTYAVYV